MCAADDRIKEGDVIKLADGFGLHPSMVGFERLFKDGTMAVVHGCGYDHPSFSHFSSMSFWHTGVPNSGEPLGWLGRLADHRYDPGTHNMTIRRRSSKESSSRSAYLDSVKIFLGIPSAVRSSKQATMFE